MTSESLARSYLVRAQKRLKALAVLREVGGLLIEHRDPAGSGRRLASLPASGRTP